MAETTALCFTGEALRIVSGKTEGNRLRITRFSSLPLPVGAVVNGVITDESAALETLMKAKSAGVRAAKLVLDSGLILLKNLDVPAMSHARLMELCRSELPGTGGGYEDLIYDYAILRASAQGEKGCSILCCAAERRLMEGYAELFSRVGVRLLCADISINSANRLTRQLPEMADKTYVLAILDGTQAVMMLYDHNRYVYSNRFRLMAERGSDALAAELAGHVSSLIQFNRSQRKEPVQTAYFGGLHENESFLCDRISAQLGIPALGLPSSAAVVTDRRLSEPFRLGDYFFATGGLLG